MYISGISQAYPRCILSMFYMYLIISFISLVHSKHISSIILFVILEASNCFVLVPQLCPISYDQPQRLDIAIATYYPLIRTR